MGNDITTNADRKAFMDNLIKELERKKQLAENPNLLTDLIKQNNQRPYPHQIVETTDE